MMAPLRSLLIDDEQASRVRLRRLLSDRPQIEIIAEAEDGLQAVQQIEQLCPDLIFLDVQMPGLDGFEVLRAIAPPQPLPLVIFVTGFDEHALRAFQAQALAYLLKPVEPEQLDATIERAWRIHSYREAHSEHEVKVRGLLQGGPRGFDRIVGRKASRILLLDPSDICFFWMDAGIVRAQATEESYWVNYALADLEATLSERSFFRAHRSYLVNLNRVSEIRSHVRGSLQLVMQDRDQSTIDVSERQARALRARIPGL
jgi:two-component system, LytTR family, response regulator